MHSDRSLRLIALREVVTLEDTGDGELAHEAEEVLQVQRQDPVGVVDDLRFLGVQDLHSLGDVGFGVGLHLLLGKLRTGGVLARRVADERRAVADDKRDVVAQVLELAHLAQRDRMAQMQIRAGRIDAQLDVERLAALELLKQAAFGHDLRSARCDDVKLFFCEQHGFLFLNAYLRDSSTCGYCTPRNRCPLVQPGSFGNAAP